MEITFATKHLKKCAHNDSYRKKKMSAIRAKKYKQRLDDLTDAETLEDCRYLPGKYHELKGNRKGQWACDLDQPNRLILIPHEKPIPTNEDGQYIWDEIKGVEVHDIVDYH